MDLRRSERLLGGERLGRKLWCGLPATALDAATDPENNLYTRCGSTLPT